MIGIKVNGDFLQLDPKTKIALQYNNVIFDNGIIQGDYSLPVNMPYQGNSKKFGFSHTLLVKPRVSNYADAKLYYKRAPIAKAILDVNSIDANYINTSLRLNISSLPCMNKKLRDFDLGGRRNLGETTADIITSMNALTGLSVGATDFNFPMIYNPWFYDGKNDDFEGWVNAYDDPTSSYKDNVTAGANITCICPMAYLYYVLKQGFASDGYAILLTDFYGPNTPLGQLTIYNNRSLDKRELSTSSSGMHAEVTTTPTFTQTAGFTKVYFDDDSTAGNYDALSAYDPGSGEYTVQAAGNHLINVNLKINFYNNSMPSTTDTVIVKLYLNGVVIKTVTQSWVASPYVNIGFTGFNYVMGAGDVGKVMEVKIQYYNSANSAAKLRLQDPSYFSVNDYSTTNNINVFNGEFYLNDHVPDITFGELLLALKETFDLEFDFFPIGEAQIIMRYVKTTIQSNNFNDYSAKACNGHTINFNKENIYRSFNFDFTGDDGYEGSNFIAYDAAQFVGKFKTPGDLNTALPPSATYINKYALVQCSNLIYRCNNVSGYYVWEYFSDNYYDNIVNAAGDIDVRPQVRPMMMRHLTYAATSFLACTIQQAGSSDEFNLGKNDYSLRLFYFMGDPTSDFGGGRLPFSTSTGMAKDGNFYSHYSFTDIYTPLNWDADSAISNVTGLSLMDLWNPLIEITQRGESFEKRFRLNLVDLINYKITNLIRFDNANFIVKTMKIELGEDMDEAVMELIKI